MANRDENLSRTSVAADGVIAEASGHLTSDVAVHLPFEALGPFKTLLKRHFSAETWGDQQSGELSDLVTPHLESGWWRYELSNGVTMEHGIAGGSYRLHVTGGAAQHESIFDQVFAGPVFPEATPHPRKVKFATGGAASPGIWYRKEDDVDGDPRVQRLFAEPDVTDVMVAGDFVTVGLSARSDWEERLVPILDIVTAEFATAEASHHKPERSREELLHEAGKLTVEHRPEELHLLDPDADMDRQMLLGALESADPRIRRIAVAVLVESDDTAFAMEQAVEAYQDESLIVRRTAIDAAADAVEQEEVAGARSLFELALASDDPWTRWKAVRALGEIGLGTSRPEVVALADDDDFQVRLEVASVLRD